MSKCLVPVVPSDGKYKINEAYIRFANSNGYKPNIKMYSSEKNIDQEDFNNIDLLLLTGGVDIEPTYYGFRNNGSYNSDELRDRVEDKLIEECVEREIPIFGICRGFQLFFISQLTHDIFWWQHINNHMQTQKRKTTFHDVNLNSNLLKKYRTKNIFQSKVWVNSFHHQGIQPKDSDYTQKKVDLPNGYTLVQDATVEHGKIDYILEAARVYRDGKTVFAGVQWHPEEMENFNDLIITMLEE